MKTVILLSGGMDSATLLHKCYSEGDAVVGLGVSYGQRHHKELQAAYNLCHDLAVPYVLAPLDGLQHLLVSALTTPAITVPDGHYQSETMKATVVPMRNAIFLSVAAGYAWSVGADRVGIAIHTGDYAIYPDCRPEFLADFNAMIRSASEGFISPYIHAPFINISKRKIADLGETLRVPWDMTWSCYKGGPIHCGVCGTCVERREALAEWNDPTEYAE